MSIWAFRYQLQNVNVFSLRFPPNLYSISVGTLIFGLWDEKWFF